MISIKPNNVPSYLKGSAFFANLSEDDEEVSVPTDCCKLDTSVANTSELEELLRTLRFWGVDQIPNIVIEYLIKNDRAVWESVTASYVTDMLAVAEIVRVVGCEREKQVCEAVVLRNLDILKCLLQHGYPAEYLPNCSSGDCQDLAPIIRAVDIAAQSGDLDILKILKQHNCDFNDGTVLAAVRAGQYECLKFLVENGCFLAKDLISWAMCSGKVEIIKYLIDTGLPWPEDVWGQLFAHEDENSKEVLNKFQVCLAYAYKLGCPRDPSTCYYASKYGWYDILVDAHEHGCTFLPFCTNIAATNGHIGCLVYLHEIGCPWDYRIADNALAQKHFDCFKYAVEHGCHVPTCTYNSAICIGTVEIIQYLRDRGISWPENILFGLDYRVASNSNEAVKAATCLTYAYQLGCPYDRETCYYACIYGWYDILVDAHQHGCKWDSRSAREAAAAGNLKCLIYLHDHGCRWDADTIISALRKLTYADREPGNAENCTEHGKTNRVVQRDNYYECLIYAVEHGCPLPAKEDNHWWPEDVELQQYLIDKGGVPPCHPKSLPHKNDM